MNIVSQKLETFQKEGRHIGFSIDYEFVWLALNLMRIRKKKIVPNSNK